MNQYKDMQMAISQMPDQMLQQVMQSQNAMPPFQNAPIMAMLEAKQRADQRQYAQAQQAAQSMGQPTVAQQIAMGLATPGLEDQAQQRMARGGIVALADGGRVPSWWEKLFGHGFTELPDPNRAMSDIYDTELPAYILNKIYHDASIQTQDVIPPDYSERVPKEEPWLSPEAQIVFNRLRLGGIQPSAEQEKDIKGPWERAFGHKFFELPNPDTPISDVPDTDLPAYLVGKIADEATIKTQNITPRDYSQRRNKEEPWLSPEARIALNKAAPTPNNAEWVNPWSDAGDQIKAITQTINDLYGEDARKRVMGALAGNSGARGLPSLSAITLPKSNNAEWVNPWSDIASYIDAAKQAGTDLYGEDARKRVMEALVGAAPRAEGLGALTDKIKSPELREALTESPEDLRGEMVAEQLQRQAQPQGEWQSAPPVQRAPTAIPAMVQEDRGPSAPMTGRQVVESRKSMDQQLAELEQLYGAPPSMAAELKGQLEKELADRRSDISEAKIERGLGAIIGALAGYFGAQGSGEMRAGQGLASALGAYLAGSSNVRGLTRDAQELERTLAQLGVNDERMGYQQRAHMIDQLLAQQAADAKAQNEWDKALYLKQLDQEGALQLEKQRAGHAMQRELLKGATKGEKGEITPAGALSNRGSIITALTSGMHPRSAEYENATDPVIREQIVQDEMRKGIESAYGVTGRGPYTVQPQKTFPPGSVPFRMQ